MAVGAQCALTEWRTTAPPESFMLHYALVFFLVAIVAALFGFGGIAAGAVGIAKIMFFVFLVMFVGTLIWGAMNRRF